MKAKKYILIGICFFLFVSLLAAVYHGRKENYIFRFDGVILSVDNSSLRIQNDSRNNVGQRDQYTIKKNDSISVHNVGGDNINFSSLAVGEHVEIIYADYGLKSKIEQYALVAGAEVPNVQQISVIE